jgi:hypothetical protein
VDVVLHARGPVVHALSIRLGPGFNAGPTIMSDPVNSNDGSGSVDSFLAVKAPPTGTTGMKRAG